MLSSNVQSSIARGVSGSAVVVCMNGCLFSQVSATIVIAGVDQPKSAFWLTISSQANVEQRSTQLTLHISTRVWSLNWSRAVMLSLRLCSQRPFSTFINPSSSPRLINLQHLTRVRHLRPIESTRLQRCYAQASKKPISKPNLSAAEQAKQQAKAAAANVGSKRYGEEDQEGNLILPLYV